MEILYYLSITCMLLFMVLATYDGFYLHIWKYRLFGRSESKFEHVTHTIRAILFPLIIWLVFIQADSSSLWIGLVLVGIDLTVLGVDAFSEKDSRESIGGLPRWEYILHLFSNSFHFAAIVLFLGTRIEVVQGNWHLVEGISASVGREWMDFVAVQVIPGSIVLAVIHLVLIHPSGIRTWQKYRVKITCC